MSHQWSRRNSHRASFRKRRRRRSVRSNSSFGLPDDEDEILQMYGKDGDLAGDPDGMDIPETVEERIRFQKDIMANVKFQPWPIRKKLQVLSLACSFVEKHEGKLSRGRSYQQLWQQLSKQINRSWNNMLSWMIPWEMRIKRIESHFGSVVTSYFIFLRWLLWLNLWLTAIQLCFVIVPEMLVGPDHGTTERKTIPDDEKASAYDLKTIWDAEGVMRYSFLFYGYYGNADTIGDGYRLPLAYLMTTLASFAFSFIVVLKKMASNSRQSRVSNKDEQFTFAWKLFSDWDYMVGNTETATTKHASIVTTMKEAIVEEQEKKQEERKYVMIFLRVLSNVIVVMLLALSTYVIQLFVERSRELELNKLEKKDLKAGFWAENELTIIMTMISTLFPSVLDLISLMEKYHPRTSLRLQLARIFLLNLINLYTLFIALYNKQNDLKKTMLDAGRGGNTLTNSSLCSTVSNTTHTVSTTAASIVTNVTANSTSRVYDSRVVSANSTCAANGTSERVNFCWETMIGQEVFKLTIMDLIFTLGQIFIIDVFRSIFVKYCNNICCWDLQKKFPEYPDFKTAENLLHLVNNQGVIWLGAFFSPGLALLNLLKLLLLMYVRCWTVIVCNVPQERIFRASRSNNFYFAMLLVMLFLSMLPPLFSIVGIQPSPSCGPFSGLEKIYYVLSKTMENELPAQVTSVIYYAASPGVILPIFMLMGMTIYYLVSVGRSLRDANNELRTMLEYERTEGKKKVYAMADAKRDMKNADAQNNAGLSKMTSAVTSMLKAAQMAKALGGLASARRNRQNNSGDAGQKVAPAVQPKPHLPVAVVHGKRSLKRSAAAARNKAMAVRRQTPRQQSPHSRNQIVAGTNGLMSTSLDSPDVSSNDDDDISDTSNYSSPSSPHSNHHHDDVSALVDNTGHLRPVMDDDVFLDIGSDSDEDNDDMDEEDSSVAHCPKPSGTTAGKQNSQKQRQSVVISSAKSKSSRLSRKIHPTGIPKITVVDFEQGEVTDVQHGKDDPFEPHMEPMVVVENEHAINGENRLKRTNDHQKQKNFRMKQKSGRNSEISQESAFDKTHSENPINHQDQRRETQDNGSITNDSNEPSKRGAKLKQFAKENSETDGSETQNKRNKPTKFSNILAHFQRMDDNG